MIARAEIMMTDDAYLAAYRKLSDQYGSNQLSMGEYLTAVQKLKDSYLQGKSGAVLPVAP
jgi:hypothetical protein